RRSRARLAETQAEAGCGGGGHHLARLPRPGTREPVAPDRMKKLFIVVIVLTLLAGAAAAWQYMRVNQPYRGYESSEQFVDLPPGSGSTTIGQRLVASGVIRDQTTFRTAIWMSGQGRHLKAGEYRFDRAMTPFEVIDKIARGDVYVVTV